MTPEYAYPDGACRAIIRPRDEIERAAEELQIPVPGRQCSRAAKHWTHGFTPPPMRAIVRTPLCTQHFKMIERRRALGSADDVLVWWYGHANERETP